MRYIISSLQIFTQIHIFMNIIKNGHLDKRFHQLNMYCKEFLSLAILYIFVCSNFLEMHKITHSIIEYTKVNKWNELFAIHHRFVYRTYTNGYIRNILGFKQTFKHVIAARFLATLYYHFSYFFFYHSRCYEIHIQLLLACSTINIGRRGKRKLRYNHRYQRTNDTTFSIITFEVNCPLT